MTHSMFLTTKVIFIGVQQMSDGLQVIPTFIWVVANAATTLIYEGLPNYPDASRFWEICINTMLIPFIQLLQL